MRQTCDVGKTSIEKSKRRSERRGERTLSLIQFPTCLCLYLNAVICSKNALDFMDFTELLEVC